MRRTAAAGLVGAAALFGAAGSALAHPHRAAHSGQVIANGQNHPMFVGDLSCETFVHLPGYGPAWYGLETAHHGPDAGDPGRGEGCYQLAGGLSPTDPASDRNKGID